MRRGRGAKKGWRGDGVFGGVGRRSCRRRRGVYPADGISRGSGRTTFRRVWLSAYHPC